MVWRSNVSHGSKGEWIAGRMLHTRAIAAQQLPHKRCPLDVRRPNERTMAENLSPPLKAHERLAPSRHARVPVDELGQFGWMRVRAEYSFFFARGRPTNPTRIPNRISKNSVRYGRQLARIALQWLSSQRPETDQLDGVDAPHRQR